MPSLLIAGSMANRMSGASRKGGDHHHYQIADAADLEIDQEARRQERADQEDEAVRPKADLATRRR